MNKKVLFLALSFFVVVFSSFSNDFGEFYSGKEITKCVCSPKGLSVWTEPSFDSEKIGNLYNYEIVKVLGRSKEIETINVQLKHSGEEAEIKNYWFFIEYKDAFGWVLGHFLANDLEEAKKTLALQGIWNGDTITSDESEAPSVINPFKPQKQTLALNYLGFIISSDSEQVPCFEYVWNGRNGFGELSLSFAADMGGGGCYESVYVEDGFIYGSYRNVRREPTEDENGEFNPYGKLALHEEHTFSYKKVSEGR